MSRNICEDQKGRSIWLPSVCGMPCLGGRLPFACCWEWEKREREREGQAGVAKGLSDTVAIYLSLYSMWDWRIRLGCGLQNRMVVVWFRAEQQIFLFYKRVFSVRPYGTCTNHQTLTLIVLMWRIGWGHNNARK